MCFDFSYFLLYCFANLKPIIVSFTNNVLVFTYIFLDFSSFWKDVYYRISNQYVEAVIWKQFDVFSTLHLRVKLVNFPPNSVLSFSMWAIFILLCLYSMQQIVSLFIQLWYIKKHRKHQIWWLLFVHPRCSRFFSTKSDVALKKYALRLPRIFNQRPTTLKMSFSAFSAPRLWRSRERVEIERPVVEVEYSSITLVYSLPRDFQKVSKYILSRILAHCWTFSLICIQTCTCIDFGIYWTFTTRY